MFCLHTARFGGKKSRALPPYASWKIVWLSVRPKIFVSIPKNGGKSTDGSPERYKQTNTINHQPPISSVCSKKMPNQNGKNDVRAMEKMGREGEAAVLILPSSEINKRNPPGMLFCIGLAMRRSLHAQQTKPLERTRWKNKGNTIHIVLTCFDKILAWIGTTNFHSRVLFFLWPRPSHHHHNRDFHHDQR